MKSLFESKNPVQYKILLDIIGKRDTKWPDDVLDKLREIVIKTAHDVGHPGNFDLLKSIIDSHTGSDNIELKNLSDEIQKWILNDDVNVVENAFNLIRKINERINAYGQQIGVSLCLEQIPSLFQINRPKANLFINFILDYSNKFTSKEEKQFLNIFKNYLTSSTLPNDLVYFLTLIPKLTKSQRSDIFDNVIELASTTQDNGIKEHCKNILIKYKDETRYSQEKKVKEIFGEDIFK